MTGPRKDTMDHENGLPMVSLGLNELIIESLDMGIFVVDDDYNILIWNRFLERYTGVSKREIIGRNIFEYFTHLKDTGWANSFTNILEGSGPLKVYHSPAFLMPVRMERRGGVFHNIKLYPLLAGVDDVRGVLVFMEDVTDHKLVEERLQNILEHANDSIFIMDPDGRFVYVNQKTLLQTGLGKEEIIGRFFTEFVEPATLSRTEGAFEALLNGEEVLGLECIFDNGKGVRMQVEINATPIMSMDNEITGIQGIARNITTRKKVEKDLKQLSEQYETILAAIPIGVALLDRDLTLHAVNTALGRLFGTSEIMARGRNLVDFLPKELFVEETAEDWILEVLEKVRHGGTYVSRSIPFRTKMGEVRLDLMVRGVPGVEGRAILVVDDVTERDKLEEQRLESIRLEAEVQNLKKVDELKSEFISVASHELRTPLTGIWIYLERLVEGKYCNIDEKHRRKIESVMAQVSLLSKIVEEMLETSRLEAKLEANEFIETRIKEVVALSLSKLGSQLEKTGHVIEQYIPDDIPMVEMDPDRIERVVTNLMSNAINYSPPKNKVQIIAEADDNELKVMIVDNGPGIADEHKVRIFDRFYVIDRSLTRKVGGVGLGLSIAKGIIENHGGRIWVEDNKDGGAIFIFTLPLRQVKDPDGA